MNSKDDGKREKCAQGGEARDIKEALVDGVKEPSAGSSSESLRHDSLVDSSSDSLRSGSPSAGSSSVDSLFAGSPSVASSIEEAGEVKTVFTIPSFVFACLFFVALAVSLVIGSPYVVNTPGEAINVLGTYSDQQMITMSEEYNKPTNDNLSMTTVRSGGSSDNLLSPIAVLYFYFNPNATVYPVEYYYGVGTTHEDYEQEVKNEMSESQDNAITAAQNYLKLSDSQMPEVKIQAGNIGGPSAGMMLALGIIDKIEGGTLTNGKAIAGTGTVDKDGNVGAIGGIRQKMIGVADQGIKYFIAPTDNLNEVYGHIPDGLTVYSSNSLSISVKIVKAIANNDFDSIAQYRVSN